MATDIDTRKLFNEVKANMERLKYCNRHNFQRLEVPGQTFPKYKCTACGGVIDGSAHHWYSEGLKHAK